MYYFTSFTAQEWFRAKTSEDEQVEEANIKGGIQTELTGTRSNQGKTKKNVKKKKRTKMRS